MKIPENQPLLVIIFFLSFLVPLISNADMGPYYCLETEVITKGGKLYHGYLMVGESGLYYQEKEGLSYYNQQKAKIQRIDVNEQDHYIITKTGLYQEAFKLLNASFFHSDSVTLNEEIIEAQSQKHSESHTFLAFVGDEVSIAKSNIKTFKIKRIIECPVGESAYTQLDIADTAWTKGKEPVVVEILGELEICQFEAISFEELSPEAKAKIEELKKAFLITNEKDEGTINPYPKINIASVELKKLKVILFMRCSC